MKSSSKYSIKKMAFDFQKKDPWYCNIQSMGVHARVWAQVSVHL